MIKISSAIFKTFFLSLCIVANTHFAFGQTASILPPGYTQYLDSNGKPLSAGKVYNYVPNTTTLKTTWQDAAETIPNTNPVVLDAGGRAKILGDGSYRQIVKDRNGVTIWDAVTSSSTGSGSTSPTATGDGDLVGTIKPWAGMTAPNQYAFTYGQEVSRTTYSVLYTAITSTQSVFCNSGSPTLNGLSDTTNFWVGMSVESTCVAAGFSTVVSKTASTVTLAANANVTTNVNATFFPWGRGNGTTTFNLPDLRGVIPAGNNNMGGVASSNLTTTYFGATNPNSIGALGGSQSTTLITANLPAYTPAGTITNGAITNNAPNGVRVQDNNHGGGSDFAGGIHALTNLNSYSYSQATSTFAGSAQGGTSTAFSKVQPTRTTNYIIKITPDTNSATASGVTSLGGMTGSIACGSGLTCTGNIISSGTAANINYTPPFTGGVTETVSAKLSTIVSPEDFGAVGDCITDDTAAVQAAIDSNNNIFMPKCYLTTGVTITSAFNGKGIYGASNGLSGMKASGNVALITINSTLAEINRIEIRDVLFLGNAGTSSEAGIKFTGANLIQHNTFTNLRCWNLYACLNNATSKVNWSIFDNFQVQEITQYGALWSKGSGTGNIFSNWTALTVVAGVQIGDGIEEVGDLIFTNMHLGSSAGTTDGIKLIGSVAYGSNITINGSQFDAELTCGLNLTGPLDRISGGGNNWGGSTIPVCKSGTITGLNLPFSYVQTVTVSADQNNYNPTNLSLTKQLRLNPTGGSWSISGLAAQFDGFEIELYNANASNFITLLNNSGLSSAGNKFQLGNALLIGPNQSTVLRYDATTAAWIALSTIIPNSGVTAATYGSTTQAAQITITPYGTISSASNVTITPAASSITGGAALTKADDTNVTLTLGGSPSTALLSAASLTLGWTGQLAVSRGGTGISSGTSGGIPYFSGGTTIASSAALGANAIVVGGGAGVTPSTPGTTPPTISSTGIITVPNTTEATSPSAASVVLSGGLASAKTLAGALFVSGLSALNATNCLAAQYLIQVCAADKATTATNFMFAARSNNASNTMDAYILMNTDSTAANRRLQMYALENGVAYRNVSLAEPGGAVAIGITNGIVSAGSLLELGTAGGIKVNATNSATSSITGSGIFSGGIGVAGAIWAGTYIATGVVAVASLPACGAGIKGARMFVNNATATTFASTVVGGGANNVPVVCDGTNWIIG